MKRFVAILNDGSFINVPATRMEKEEYAILVWDNKELVVWVDTCAVISAHIGERKE
jgi:hypothetical protein